ncbi:uncharacterized protein LOC112605554 [Theropithecus gelada]|uniref:uncharacterized protein LOC112605554 n=1 Tax=Theropithecus gelada TaxID=9565 RepID=UPI000DC19EA7|nr:uncharacterized protein LOC112605554 [Theropithecus gelada]
MWSTGIKSYTGSTQGRSSWTGSSRACSSWTGSRMTHSLRSSRAYSNWTGSSHRSHSPPWSPHRSHSPPWSPHRSHSPPWSPHRSHSWSRNSLAHSSTRACSSRPAHSSWSHSPHSQSHSPHSRSRSPHSRSHSLQSSHSSPWFWCAKNGEGGRGAGERQVQMGSSLGLGPLYPCPGIPSLGIPSQGHGQCHGNLHPTTLPPDDQPWTQNPRGPACSLFSTGTFSEESFQPDLDNSGSTGLAGLEMASRLPHRPQRAFVEIARGLCIWFTLSARVAASL